MEIPKVTFKRSHHRAPNLRSANQFAYVAGQENPLVIERNEDIRSGLLGCYSVDFYNMGGHTRNYHTQREAKAGIIDYVTSRAIFIR